MSDPIQPDRRRANLLHGALTGGLVVVTLILVLLRPNAAMTVSQPGIFTLQCIALGFAASGFGAATIIRSRIEPVPPGGSEGGWWQENLRRALLAWVLTESPSVVGAVLYFVTGSFIPLLVTTVGLVFLIVNAPGRLVGR